MEASRAQLQAVSERVTLAQAKIEKIKGSKKAIKVVRLHGLSSSFCFSLYPKGSSAEEQTLGFCCCPSTSLRLASEQELR